MEIKKTESRRPSQDLACTNSDDYEEESKTYTCTFCKRGFSNAQALGGHMNVHRKDRARLKESIQETLITTETRKGMDSTDHGSSSDEMVDGVTKRPWTFTEGDSLENPRKKDNCVNYNKPSLQLSLCIESSTTSDSCIRSNKMSSLFTSSKEVDLELRLGIDSEETSRDHVTRD